MPKIRAARSLSALLCTALCSTLAAIMPVAFDAVPVSAQTPSTLVWGPCEPGVDPEFECTTLQVPLDPMTPAAGTLPIAVIRLPARTSARQGAILLNPGGPGGSGYDFAAFGGAVIDEELGLDRTFDLIGFDPRGVGRSSGISCSTIAGCRGAYGDTLRHYSTVNTAADMEAIRVALGDAQISFFGISYGTYLGAVYASLYPNSVKSMVLDAANNPVSTDPTERWVTEFGGAEVAFTRWVSWCQADSTCALHGSDVAARWSALYTKLEAAPVPAGSGSIDGETFQYLFLETLKGVPEWPLLARAVVDAEAGSGAMFAAIGGFGGDGLGLGGLGHDSLDQVSMETSSASNPVISCASGTNLPLVADKPAMLAELSRVAPHMTLGFSEFNLSYAEECQELIGAAVAPFVPTYSGPGPILVTGGLSDPATPYSEAIGLVASLGQTATLLPYTGDGHGSVLTSRCVGDFAASLLKTGVLPPVNSACSPDPAVQPPAFWGTLTRPVIQQAEPTLRFALGLDPADYFSEVYIAADPATITSPFNMAIEAAGVVQKDQGSLGPGVPVVRYQMQDGSVILQATFTPEAFSYGGQWRFASLLVPSGQSAVAFVVPPR